VSRRDNADLRCDVCKMHGNLCVCALVQRIETRTRLVLVIHRYEDRKPTNTGKLAARCLTNSEVIVRGRKGWTEAPLHVPDEYEALVVYPSDDAVPIERYAASPRPIVLVVPDGNWRQAAKAIKRVPGLSTLPRVSLPSGAPSSYRLRAEPQPGGLATLEAIARAFGVLEGQHVHDAMMKPFRAMVERTLWARGLLDASRVQDGLPAGAQRHAPTRASAAT
jgi:DTW domain-containing protein YfiP